MKFSGRGKLVGHMKLIHQGTKDFQCNECAMKFGVKASLMRHMKQFMEKIKSSNAKNVSKCSNNVFI